MSPKKNHINCTFLPYTLYFRFDAGTSRGVLRKKTGYFIKVWKENNEDIFGLGEAGPLPGLSLDDRGDFEDQLRSICQKVQGAELPNSFEEIRDWVKVNVPEEFPSIRFAFETALLDLQNGGRRTLFANPLFDQQIPIPINGLIWMGDRDRMKEQIDEKIKAGFNCIKIKIGAIDFEEECGLLRYIRDHFEADKITIRVDANGAFSPEEAPKKLERLSGFDLHSIEQPIRQGQWQEMAKLCRESPLAIALDEELIGIHDIEAKEELLAHIKPPYIILKPTLLGGLGSCKEWIDLAEKMGVGWWMTSALESNIGLNAIAQFTSTFQVNMPQGLGTGQLYHNNIPSPLIIENGFLHYRPAESGWDLRPIMTADWIT